MSLEIFVLFRVNLARTLRRSCKILTNCISQRKNLLAYEARKLQPVNVIIHINLDYFLNFQCS